MHCKLWENVYWKHTYLKGKTLWNYITQGRGCDYCLPDVCLLSRRLAINTTLFGLVWWPTGQPNNIIEHLAMYVLDNPSHSELMNVVCGGHYTRQKLHTKSPSESDGNCQTINESGQTSLRYICHLQSNSFKL